MQQTNMRLHLSQVENHESKVINILIVWRPMSLLEGGSQETWKNGVANLHVMNGVRGTRVINWSVANPYYHGNWMR